MRASAARPPCTEPYCATSSGGGGGDGEMLVKRNGLNEGGRMAWLGR